MLSNAVKCCQNLFIYKHTCHVWICMSRLQMSHCLNSMYDIIFETNVCYSSPFLLSLSIFLSFWVYTNKVREVVVAQGRLCVQTHRSVLKRTDLLLLFHTSLPFVTFSDLLLLFHTTFSDLLLLFWKSNKRQGGRGRTRSVVCSNSSQCVKTDRPFATFWYLPTLCCFFRPLFTFSYHFFRPFVTFLEK